MDTVDEYIPEPERDTDANWSSRDDSQSLDVAI